MSDENAVFILNLLQSRPETSRDLQLTALEQLCLFILQMDTSEALKKEYPPSAFIPALVKLFVDFDSPAAVLESASRVLTYYTQILPLETASCLFEIEGSICAICLHLESSDLVVPVESDLAQQIIKLMEELVRRESNVYKIIGCTSSVLEFLSNSWKAIHLDTLRSGLYVAGRLSNLLDIWLKEDCTAVQPCTTQNTAISPSVGILRRWISSLIQMITHRDLQVTCGCLDCLHTVFTACRRLPNSKVIIEQIATEDNLVEKFLSLLVPQEQMRTNLESSYSTRSNPSTKNCAAVKEEQTLTENSSPPAQLPHTFNDGAYLTGYLAAMVVELILSLCRGQSSLLVSISNSCRLTNLFQYALLASKLKTKTNMGKANSIDSTNDVLLPTLHLADGLLNLSMSMVPSENTASAVDTVVVPNNGMPSSSSVLSPDFQRTQGTSLGVNQSECNQTSRFRKQWKACVTARLISPKPLEPLVNRDRCGLPNLRSLGSSSSGASVGSQIETSVSQGIFLAARQAFDQLGIADDARVAMDRFHHWIANSLANKGNLGDLVSILQSAQVSCNWLDSCGQPLLAWALAAGNGAALTALCTRGVDVNSGLVGSALHYAAAYGQVQIVRALLGLTPYAEKHGTENSLANPRLRDIYGRTPAQLALYALNAAYERGTNPERYRKSLKMLQKSEEQFKQELSIERTTPFAKLLRIALPVLTEVYLMTSKPSLRIRALQIICRCVRSKTGFGVLYQMQKWRPTEDEGILFKAISANGSQFCNNFTRMLASVLSQGSSEEVFLMMTMIPALIDLPCFLTAMHRFGIPQLLSWRSSNVSLPSNLSGAPESTESEQDHTEALVDDDEGLMRERVSMYIPSFVEAPSTIPIEPREVVSRFQCMHELGYYQAYTFGDWCLMRTGPRSVLLFHEFALFWIDVVYIQSESKKETECQMQVYLVQRKENVPKVGQPSSSSPPPCSDERGCEKAAGTVNKTEKIAKKYLLPSSASESADGLTVLLLQFDGPPIERNDLASDLWLKAHPLIVQIRHMFYGMLPLPLCKTASPLRTIPTNATHVGKGRQPVLACSSDKGQALPLLPIQSTSNLPTEELSGTEPDGRTMNRLCAAASSGNQQHSEEEDLVHASNALISDSLLPATDNIANSSSSTNEMTTNPQVPLSSDCIYNVTVSFGNKAFSNCIQNLAEETSETRDFPEDEQLNNEQAMNISSHMENDDAKVEVRSPSRVLPRSQSNLEADRIKQTNSPKGTHEHVEASQDKTRFNPIRSDVLDHFKFRDIAKNEQHGACENSVHPIKSTETKHEVSEAIRETKTASAGLSIRYQANFEAPNSRQNLTASGKLTALYVDAIRISVSPQGLWLILDPRQDALNQTTVPLTEDQQITVCSHPECQGKWNLDDSDDETVYNETTETTCWSALKYTEVPSSGHGTRTYERDWQKLRKILTNAADPNKSRECLREQLAYKQSKILCFPTRLSGVRTYGETSQIVYQSGSMTRSSGNLRLTKFLENLNIGQRQYVRFKHREARLRNIQRTVGRVSIILSDLLMRLMEKKRQSLKNKFAGTSHASYPTYQLVLANELSRHAAWLETCITPDTKMLIQGEELVDERTRITELMSCLEKATPYEIISSRFVPVLWSWLKNFSEHVADSGTEIRSTESDEKLNKMWTHMDKKLLARKLISVLEFVERYPIPVTQFINIPEQLLTKTIQMQPQLVNSTRKRSETNTAVETFHRRVDLSHHHLYVQPLVTVKQLQDWVVSTAEKIPWYNDELRYMGFVHDMEQEPNCIRLVPPRTLFESPYASYINDNTCNAKIFEGGVFEWLGTNGGREEKWANPLRLHGFVKLLSSDSKLNEDPVTLGSVLMTRAEKSHDADRGVHNEPSKPWRNFHKSHSPYCSRTRSCASTFLSGVRIRPASNTTWSRRATAWIAFDLGIQLELSHYLIQVPVHADKWPRLFNWQIQGSNNGIQWTTLKEHHVLPVGNPADFWGPNGHKLWTISSTEDHEKRVWRFIRLIVLPLRLRSSTQEQKPATRMSLDLRGIEFFGTVKKLFTVQDTESASNAVSYIQQFQPGTYVVPNVPLALCDSEFPAEASSALCEHWPISNNPTAQSRSTQQTSSAVANENDIQDELPTLGRVLSSVDENGHLSVQWLDGPTTGFSEKSQTDSKYFMDDAEGRFDLRIPTDKEVHQRMDLLKLKSSSIKHSQVSKQLEKDLTNLNSELLAHNQSMQSGVQETSQEFVLVSNQPSLASYLLPITPNWLSEALLPTFTRIMPLLFAGYGPRVLRDPPAYQSQITQSAINPRQATSTPNMIPLATHSSNWEDANSLSIDQELENQNEAQRSAPYLTMSDQHEEVTSQSLFNEPGAGVPTSGFSDGSPARQANEVRGEVVNCATSVPVIVAGSNSSLPPNPDDTHTATVIPSPGLDAASNQPTTICSELDGRVPWKVMLAPDNYDSNEEDGVTEEEFRENDPEYGVETEENPEDSCAIFASFRALTDDTQKQEEMDAELEAIGRTLELRIMANASESGCSPHSPTHCPPLHTGSQAKPLHGKRRKFDQWEKIDPVDSEIISKQCMGISTVSTVLDPKTKLTHIQISTSPSNAGASSCDVAPCVPCPSAPSFSVSQVDDPWKFLFDPLATSVDRSTRTTGVSQPGPSLLSPPPVPLAPHTPRDAHRMTQSMHSHKSTFRPQVTETIKVETIEAHLSGLIPPFDSRSSSAHQPSTATFTIPNCVPWPAIQWSREILASSSNSYDTTLIGSGRKLSKTAQLWFHREPVVDAITVVLGSSLSTVSPRSSLSRSTSDSLGANPENASFLNNELTLDSMPFQNPLEPSHPQTKPVRYYLSRDDVHLLRYLLDGADYTEEFMGSGVLKPARTQFTRLWNQTYLLDYALEECDQQNELSRCELKTEREPKHKEEVCNPPSFADSKWREKLLDSLAMLYEISTASRHRHTSRNSAMCVDQMDDYSGCEIKTPIKRCSETNVFMSEIDRQDDADNDELLTAFQSSRMTRKLMLFAHDIWFVLSHTHVLCHTNSDLSEERRVNETVRWISPFVAKFKFLFPFEVRHEFWRVSSLGISRAISWLQKQAGNARTPNASANLTGLSSMLQRLDVGMGFRERQNGRIFGPPVSFSWTPSTIMNTNSGFGSSAYGSSLGFANPPSLTALGRLQRHMARVPRPRTTFDSSEVCEDSDPLLYLCSPFLGGRNTFWCSSVRLLLAHADFQQELEVEFEGEEGTGLGPTMEFYALLSAELRRHKHGLWVSEDRACARTSDCLMRNTIKDESDTCQFLHSYQDTALDTECFWKSCAEEDFYVNPPMGLFPAPWPEEQLPPGTELRFYVLGVAVAKCLADQRQMDLPLSFSFLYLLTEEGNKESQLNEKLPCDPNSIWPSGILNIRHFSEIFPERGRFLSDLLAYIHERDAINFTPGSTEYERADLELQQRFFSCDLASLCISMAFSPVTMRFGQTEFPLTRRYDDSTQLEMANSVHDINEEDEQLDPSNADLYVHRSLQFALVHGIRRQLHAFRAGFERVIPLSSLSMFTPRELGRLISGESSPDWSAEEFLMYCEPAAGYSRTSKGFLMLVETLASFDTLERRAFLRFVTGCPTLPPGGLRNLHPKLKVAKKDGSTCGPFPSVNTCMHYLKLPEYQSVSEMKQHLLAAASQRGFYLN